ncbi:hypothetical protein AAFG07_32595 [Bradyrhizobium sp. B097]|uniref:hypothetical protein n=1 Tax=Bradyrhizobium sp. B097 TaxID=3140244 RepID=UPI0031830E22
MSRRPRTRALAARTSPSNFHSLEVAAIVEFMTRLNEERPIRELGMALQQMDRPALGVLPKSPGVFAE